MKPEGAPHDDQLAEQGDRQRLVARPFPLEKMKALRRLLANHLRHASPRTARPGRVSVPDADRRAGHPLPLSAKSKHPNALPMIMTHGWPGSVVEFLKVLGPLTDPTAHGGKAEDAFHVVTPSLPGYGFSDKPTARGWGIPHIARAWATLMKRLGYGLLCRPGGRLREQQRDPPGWRNSMWRA